MKAFCSNLFNVAINDAIPCRKNLNQHFIKSQLNVAFKIEFFVDE